MNILGNEEHREAYQADVDKERKEFISTLSEADQKKFDAVDQCFQILSEAKLPAYLFAMLPHKDGYEEIMQFNNYGDFVEWKGGKMTQESKIKMCLWQRSFIAAFGFWILQIHQPTIKLTFTEIAQLFERWLREYFNFRHNKIEIPEITMIKEGKV